MGPFPGSVPGAPIRARIPKRVSLNDAGRACRRCPRMHTPVALPVALPDSAAPGTEPGKGPNYHRPVTSGLQFLSGADQGWSLSVDARRLRRSAPRPASRWTEAGQSDLTRI